MLRQRLLSVDTLLLLVFGHVIKLGMQASRRVRGRARWHAPSELVLLACQCHLPCLIHEREYM